MTEHAQLAIKKLKQDANLLGRKLSDRTLDLETVAHLTSTIVTSCKRIARACLMMMQHGDDAQPNWRALPDIDLAPCNCRREYCACYVVYCNAPNNFRPPPNPPAAAPGPNGIQADPVDVVMDGFDGNAAAGIMENPVVAGEIHHQLHIIRPVVDVGFQNAQERPVENNRNHPGKGANHTVQTHPLLRQFADFLQQRINLPIQTNQQPPRHDNGIPPIANLYHQLGQQSGGNHAHGQPGQALNPNGQNNV